MSGTGTRRAPGRPARYHHGDLRNALLAAAEAILENEGLQGLSLRAVARRAGVSHAAPAHHFGDLTGLLSELAAVGFARLAARFHEALASTRAERRPELAGLGRAYVAFARDHPGLFLLMFRNERLDMTRPALRQAAGEAGRLLRNFSADGEGGPALGNIARATAAWSLVHGFAMLLIDGRLRGMLSALPELGNAEALLDAVLAITNLDRPPDAPGRTRPLAAAFPETAAGTISGARSRMGDC